MAVITLAFDNVDMDTLRKAAAGAPIEPWARRVLLNAATLATNEDDEEPEQEAKPAKVERSSVDQAPERPVMAEGFASPAMERKLDEALLWLKTIMAELCANTEPDPNPRRENERRKAAAAKVMDLTGAISRKASSDCPTGQPDRACNPAVHRSGQPQSRPSTS